MEEGKELTVKSIETGSLHVNGVPLDLARERIEPLSFLPVQIENFGIIDASVFPRDRVIARSPRGESVVGNYGAGTSSMGILSRTIKNLISDGFDVSGSGGIVREQNGDEYRLVSREINFTKIGPLLFGKSKSEMHDTGEELTEHSFMRFGLNKVLGITNDAWN